MKIKVETKELKEALARLASIPGANNASIHTQAVTMTADLAGLTLMRFTSESRISVIIEDGIDITDDTGTPRVGHGPFSALINACQAKHIEIESSEKTLDIASGRSRSKLKVFSEASVDAPEPELESESITVLLEDLTKWLSFPLAAASRDSAYNAVYCGVGLRMVEGKLFFMATDRKRCHVAMVDDEMAVDCVIPTEGVEAILKSISGMTGGCTFAISDNTASVISDRLEISVSLLKEKFPQEVQSLFAQAESSIESKIVVNRDEFCEELTACAAINEDEFKTVTIKAEAKQMQIFGSGRDSEMAAIIDCATTAPVVFGLPGRHVAKGLKELEVGEDGRISLQKYLGVILARSAERMAFFAVAKPQA